MTTQRIDKYTETDKFRDVYSDFMVDLVPHPNTQDLVRNVNEAAIKRSLRNLLLTNPYERLFQPNLGSKIRKLLFEPITPELGDLIKTYVTETINNHEPRVKLIEVSVVPDEAKNRYNVDIFFYIINKTEPVGLSVVLYRIR